MDATNGSDMEPTERSWFPKLWMVIGAFLGVGLVGVMIAQQDGGDPANSSTTLSEASEVGQGDAASPDVVVEPVLHVAPGGDDAGTGRDVEQPLATLGAALDRAVPGDEIRLAPGTYGPTSAIGLSGEPERPIRVVAPDGEVVIDAGNLDSNDGLYLENVAHLEFSGLTIRGGIHGTYIRASSNLVFRDVRWEDVGQEGVQLADATSDVLFEDCAVIGTGLRPGDLEGIPFANFGEGFYIGSSTGVDPVARITVRNCEIANTTAEGIDIKPGSLDILVEDNRVHDVTTANSGAIVAGLVFEAVIPHFDAGIVIRNNRIWNVTSTSQFQDGNAINVNTPALIYNNVMWNLQHRGILVDANFQNPDARLVRIYNNTIFGAGLTPLEIREGEFAGIGEVINNIGPDTEGNIAATREMFVDAAAGDFRLVDGSSAIDAGVAVEVVSTDIEGRSRPLGATWDLGAHEADAPAPAATTTTTTVSSTIVPGASVTSG